MAKNSRAPHGAALCFGLLVVSLLLIAGCRDATDPNQGSRNIHETVVASIESVRPNANNVLSVSIVYNVTNADSLRVIAVDQSDGSSIVTPASPVDNSGAGSVLVLGLEPSTQYDYTLEAWPAGESKPEQVATMHGRTSALPDALKDSYLKLVSGSYLPGYILTTIPTSPAGGSHLVVFDSTGRLVWYRTFAGGAPMEAKQQGDGNYTIYVGSNNGSQKSPGQYVEVNPAGDIVRTIQVAAPSYLDPHELLTTYDGDQFQAAYFSVFDFRKLDQTRLGGEADADVAGHQLVKMDATGNIQVIFDAWEHLSPDDAELLGGDWDHPNSIDIDTDGNFIVSFRVLSTIVKIDAKTGAVLWQLGGVKNQFTFVNDPFRGFSGQHDARMLPNGHLLVYDNGTSHVPSITRVLEYKLDIPRRTATLVWSFLHPDGIFTQFTGGAQRLSNGDTFIAYPGVNVFTEVDKNGNILSQTSPMLSAATGFTFYRGRKIGSLYKHVAP